MKLSVKCKASEDPVEVELPDTTDAGQLITHLKEKMGVATETAELQWRYVGSQADGQIRTLAELDTFSPALQDAQRTELFLSYPASSVVPVAATDHVMLVRHTQDGTKPRWTCAGGVCEEGETTAEGAIRECREESGIALSKDNMRLVNTRHRVAHNGKFYHVTTYAHATPTRIYPTCEGEFDHAWIRCSEIKNMTDFRFHDDRERIQEAIDSSPCASTMNQALTDRPTSPGDEAANRPESRTPGPTNPSEADLRAANTTIELTSDTSDEEGDADQSPVVQRLCLVQCVTESLRTMLVKPDGEEVAHVKGNINHDEKPREAARRLLLTQTGLPATEEELTKVEVTRDKDGNTRSYELHRFVMVMARRRVPATPRPSEIGPHWFKRTAIVEDTTLNWQSSEDLQLALKAIMLGPERVKQTTAWEDLTEPKRGSPEKTCSSRSCENK
eukprot:SAG11_NODE_3142_length_2656_cov_3.797028_2_plen_445_part_00